MIQYIFYLLAISILISCVDPDHCNADLEGNVINDPLIGKLFVPNIFSPNGDGINDLYRVYGELSEEVFQVQCNIYKDNSILENDLIYAMLLSNSEEFGFTNWDEWVGWDGSNSNIFEFEGEFIVEMIFLLEMQEPVTFQFEAKSRICFDADFDFVNSGCAFPNQYNGDGGYDDSINPQELKEPDC